ncbi:MAG TPA: DUF1572 family protein [Ferruginibacter sp.]|nr:DUF1572 family protein [Ferruginibacter sp.]HRE63906.1 DUF1572 family protein [Ferruginibacter sp.]
MNSNYLNSVKQQMLYYKSLGEKSIAQLEPALLFKQPNEDCNSIAMIIQHMHGNMLSRWTDFLNSDGEKEWRQRDAEFEIVLSTKEEVMTKWEEGWKCLMDALNSLNDSLLSYTVLIRNEPHTATEAINRQLAHYPYHVGQIVFYTKALIGAEFTSLSIAKNQSQQFNKEKFDKG